MHSIICHDQTHGHSQGKLKASAGASIYCNNTIFEAIDMNKMLLAILFGTHAAHYQSSFLPFLHISAIFHTIPNHEDDSYSSEEELEKINLKGSQKTTICFR